MARAPQKGVGPAAPGLAQKMPPPLRPRRCRWRSDAKARRSRRAICKGARPHTGRMRGVPRRQAVRPRAASRAGQEEYVAGKEAHAALFNSPVGLVEALRPLIHVCGRIKCVPENASPSPVNKLFSTALGLDHLCRCKAPPAHLIHRWSKLRDKSGQPRPRRRQIVRRCGLKRVTLAGPYCQPLIE